jgi:hypothetical protein
MAAGNYIGSAARLRKRGLRSRAASKGAVRNQRIGSRIGDNNSPHWTLGQRCVDRRIICSNDAYYTDDAPQRPAPDDYQTILESFSPAARSGLSVRGPLDLMLYRLDQAQHTSFLCDLVLYYYFWAKHPGSVFMIDGFRKL